MRVMHRGHHRPLTPRRTTPPCWSKGVKAVPWEAVETLLVVVLQERPRGLMATAATLGVHSARLPVTCLPDLIQFLDIREGAVEGGDLTAALGAG